MSKYDDTSKYIEGIKELSETVKCRYDTDYEPSLLVCYPSDKNEADAVSDYVRRFNVTVLARDYREPHDYAVSRYDDDGLGWHFLGTSVEKEALGIARRDYLGGQRPAYARTVFSQETVI